MARAPNRRNRQKTSEGAESRAKISHWLCRASNVLQNPVYRDQAQKPLWPDEPSPA
jgi:hypothetical protein